MAPGSAWAYPFFMGRPRRILASTGALLLALGAVSAQAPAAPAKPPAGDEKVPLYTNEDLERMFGPSTASTGEIDSAIRPEDWSWVEQFLDRQYARLDADRSYDLDRRALGAATPLVSPYLAYPVAWRLGFPASTWWNTVFSHYRSGSTVHTPAIPERRTGAAAGPSSRSMAPRAAGHGDHADPRHGH